MTDELEDKLCKRFNFYRRELPITQSLMYFGFEHGDGWFDIIWELSEKIERVLNKYYSINKQALDLLVDYPAFNVTQVKEKFGTLCFYYEMRLDVTEAHDDIVEVINEAEAKSAKTCEKCGRPGTQTENRWIQTLCEDCKKGSKNA